MPKKKRVRLSVLLFNEDQGDPVVSDGGFACLDIHTETGKFGAYSTQSGQPTAQLLPKIGITCYPYPVLQDTRKAQFLTHNATDWEEWRPGTAPPRIYRLIQTNTAANLQWWATSTYSLLENPHVAWSVVLPDAPADHDATTYPVYSRIEFGGEWGIQFGDHTGQATIGAGCRLMRKIAGVWTGVMDLDEPARLEKDADERLVMLRCDRGKIGISTNGGREWKWYPGEEQREARPVGTITVAALPWTYRGQGGVGVVGLHQLRYYDGAYDSVYHDTLTARTGVTPTIRSRYDAPQGSSVGWANRSTDGTSFAAYRLTLTPKPVLGVPFTFYVPPVVYSTTFQFPVTTKPGTGAGTYTTPWDQSTVYCKVTKPFDLGGGTCVLKVRMKPADAFSGNFRDRKIQVQAAWEYDDGSVVWWTLFTGYIVDVGVAQTDFQEVIVTFTADCAAHLLKRSWTPLQVLALSELSEPSPTTLNTAGDYILATEALTAAYRSWHAKGDLFRLDPGTPEDPFELVKDREDKWATLVRIYGHAGLEVAVTDTGGFLSQPRNTVNATVHTYRGTVTTNKDLAIQGLANRVDYRESATAVLVSAKGTDGGRVMVWARDAYAATAGSGRYTPLRKVLQDELSGTVVPGLLQSRAGSLIEELFPHQEPEFSITADFDLGRRDEVDIYGGGGVGLPDGTPTVCLTLEHTLEINDQGEYTHTSSAGVRRLL